MNLDLRYLVRLGIEARIKELQAELNLLLAGLKEIKTPQAKEAKKVHWTQTHNGKKKMALIQKKVWAAKKAKA